MRVETMSKMLDIICHSATEINASHRMQDLVICTVMDIRDETFEAMDENGPIVSDEHAAILKMIDEIRGLIVFRDHLGKRHLSSNNEPL